MRLPSFRFVIFVPMLLLAACAAPRHEIVANTPTSARPIATAAATGVPSGGIYQQVAYRPLFEDRKPRYIGDILTVQINEKLNASQSANSNTERTSEFDVALPGVKGFLGKKINPLTASGSVSNTFDGKGATTSSNLFTGAITATVVEVLANGNLMVRGEKQLALTEGAEVIQVSGIIRPDDVSPNNMVQSRRLANAQISYRGTGDMAAVAKTGWGTKALLQIWPF